MTSSLQYSTEARTDRVTALITRIGASPKLIYYAGAMPTLATAVTTQAILATFNLPASPWGAPANGTAALAGIWEDPSADGSGLTGFFRLYKNDGTTAVIQGLLSMPWKPIYAFKLNQLVHGGGNVYKVTTAGTSDNATPPTGTSGSPVTSGTAQFTYLGPLGLAIENSEITINQDLLITQFDLTDGNA